MTAVGSVATQNLAELGHVTLKFDGQRIPELPGSIYLLGGKLEVLQHGDVLMCG